YCHENMEENNNLSSENIQPDERTIGIFKYLDYDLDVNERRAKFTKYDSVLCEICNKEIDKPDYRCKDCYDKETDNNEKNRMVYGRIGIFKTSDYGLGMDEREKKYKNYHYILCENCNQEISHKYYYCTNCYEETDNNEKIRMRYGQIS